MDNLITTPYEQLKRHLFLNTEIDAFFNILSITILWRAFVNIFKICNTVKLCAVFKFFQAETADTIHHSALSIVETIILR